MASEKPRLTKSSSFSHHKNGTEWRNTLAARSRSAKNILAQSSYEVFKAEALGQNKHNAPPKDSVKDYPRTHGDIQTDQQSNYQPSISRASSSSTGGESDGNNHRHAIKLIDFSRRDKVLDLKDDDPRLIVILDPDQFVKDLKELDPQNLDPLPCNIMWAWSQVDKGGNGVVSRKDIYWMRKKYAELVRGSANIENLIRKHDTRKNSALNPLELRALLSDACGRPASAGDLAGLRARLAALAAACAHGGLGPPLTADPHILSRAIFEWWWADCGHCVRLARAVAPDRGAHPWPAAGIAAGRVPRGAPAGGQAVARGAEELSMDNLDGGGGGGLGAGFDLLRDLGDRVQQACVPVGQALFACAAPRALPPPRDAAAAAAGGTGPGPASAGAGARRPARLPLPRPKYPA